MGPGELRKKAQGRKEAGRHSPAHLSLDNHFFEIFVMRDLCKREKEGVLWQQIEKTSV
jgi:hypothetical protein